MFLADPPRTPYDLYFRLWGIPVRVHPLFWAVGLLISFAPGPPLEMFIRLGVWFVSILVHEMGHAWMMRYYGWNPSVTLYAMGGFARYDHGFTTQFSSYQRPGNREYAQIIIAAAGPGAGFLLAGLSVVVAELAGADIKFAVGRPSIVVWHITGLEGNFLMMMHFTLFINIYWGLVNLLPVYPLDGGQISRELFMRYVGNDGLQKSLWLSVGVGAAMALFGFMHDYYFIGLIFGYLAFSSYQLLQTFSGGGFGGFGRNL
ncbi:MAG: site-2 protease family protein [Pirellulaceae bacterium]|nr:site-2 protease family protein [Pirellulaceae bacterium]